MKVKQKLQSEKISYFRLVLLGIFLFSLVLRFWNLGQFNKLVFDEVYYAKFANNYLIGTKFFNAHPPLSQYLIAIGIWLGSHFPAAPDSINALTGSLRSTISYRWLNALTGSFIPLIVAGIAYQLTRRRSYALIAAVFAATDGLFLVESRYALNNIYLISLGLLGQLFFLIYINSKKPKQRQLIFSGIFLGSAAAIKWNGLSFLLGVYLLLGIAKLGNFWENWQPRQDEAMESSSPVSLPRKVAEATVFEKVASINLPLIIINFVILPIFTYSLLWIPHLIMNPKYGFWQMQKEIFFYHQRIGNTPDIHPYCSPWYSWLIMWRTVAYFYEKSTGSTPVIHDVHAMGNPLLWWLSTLAIFMVILLLLLQLFARIRKTAKPLSNSATWLGTYIAVNYVANLLPWITVKRCIFLYHYMGAYIFAWLALAWAIDYCLQHHYSSYRIAGLTVMFLVFAAFIYWLPIYLGLPLSQEGLNFRLLFNNWI